jgi:hypothetical protein
MALRGLISGDRGIFIAVLAASLCALICIAFLIPSITITTKYYEISNEWSVEECFVVDIDIYNGSSRACNGSSARYCGAWTVLVNRHVETKIYTLSSSIESVNNTLKQREVGHSYTCYSDGKNISNVTWEIDFDRIESYKIATIALWAVTGIVLIFAFCTLALITIIICVKQFLRDKKYISDDIAPLEDGGRCSY